MSDSDWLGGIVPSVPEDFVSRLALMVEEVAAPGSLPKRGALPDPDYLMDAALAALVRALAPEGRERRGAFDLLVADALATWAAEAGLDEEDPEARLGEMVECLAEGPRVR